MAKSKKKKRNNGRPQRAHQGARPSPTADPPDRAYQGTRPSSNGDGGGGQRQATSGGASGALGKSAVGSDLDGQLADIADRLQKQGEQVTPDQVPWRMAIRGAELSKSDDPDKRGMGDRMMAGASPWVRGQNIDPNAALAQSPAGQAAGQQFAQATGMGATQQPQAGGGMAGGTQGAQAQGGTQQAQQPGMPALQQADSLEQQLALLEERKREARQAGDQEAFDRLSNIERDLVKTERLRQQNEQRRQMQQAMREMDAGEQPDASKLTSEQLQDAIGMPGSEMGYANPRMSSRFDYSNITEPRNEQGFTADEAREIEQESAETSVQRINKAVQDMGLERDIGTLGPDATDEDRYSHAQAILEAQEEQTRREMEEQGALGYGIIPTNVSEAERRQRLRQRQDQRMERARQEFREATQDPQGTPRTTGYAIGPGQRADETNEQYRRRRDALARERMRPEGPSAGERLDRQEQQRRQQRTAREKADREAREAQRERQHELAVTALENQPEPAEPIAFGPNDSGIYIRGRGPVVKPETMSRLNDREKAQVGAYTDMLGDLARMHGDLVGEYGAGSGQAKKMRDRFNDTLAKLDRITRSQEQEGGGEQDQEDAPQIPQGATHQSTNPQGDRIFYIPGKGWVDKSGNTVKGQ